MSYLFYPSSPPFTFPFFHALTTLPPLPFTAPAVHQHLYHPRLPHNPLHPLPSYPTPPTPIAPLKVTANLQAGLDTLEHIFLFVLQSNSDPPLHLTSKWGNLHISVVCQIFNWSHKGEYYVNSPKVRMLWMWRNSICWISHHIFYKNEGAFIC